MLVLSVVNVLEEAASPDDRDSLGGNIIDLDNLFDPANLACLSEFADALCFLAFHPTADRALADYVRSGTLPDDSGPRTLVMFTLDEPAPGAVRVGPDSMRKHGLAFHRTGRTPIREWLLRVVQLARKHRGDVVSVIGLLK